MNLLAIDTSTERASVALSAFGMMHEIEEYAMRRHAQRLLPMIQEVLQRADMNLKQLEGVVFGRGPGSFTGLRIACSIAKALAYAHDLPVYPVSGLSAVAYHVFQFVASDKAVLSVLDARMQQLYWGCFSSCASEVVEQVGYPHEIQPLDSGALILAGVGFEPYKSALPEFVKSRIVSEQIIYPRASCMIAMVQSGLVKPLSAEEALPVYVRNQVTQGETRG